MTFSAYQAQPGDILDGRYRVDRPIARGGMSTVYRCVDLRLGRAVAAKVMHEELSTDPAFVERFEREARAMAQIEHPNVVGVYDFSAHSSPVFLVMELITGGTLRELLAERGPMPPHAATAVMRAVLQGLSALHARGLIHRDIKPDNVLIHGDSRVKIGDFGLVRSSSTATTSNLIMGTVSYLAPEQVDGSALSPATDVYSAGVVLYELLTGTTPFSGESPLAHAIARLQEDVAAPSQRQPNTPPLFDALVATATARSAADRFADAAEFLAALDDVAASLELPAYTVPVPTISAAGRTAAAPTDFSGLGATTTVIPPAESTEIIASEGGSNPDVPPAELAAQQPEHTLLDERPQLSFAGHSPAAGQAVPAPMPAHPAPPASMSAHQAPPAHTAPPTGQLPPQAAADELDSPPAKISNQSVAGTVLLLALGAVLATVVGIYAWWVGSGFYTGVPELFR